MKKLISVLALLFLAQLAAAQELVVDRLEVDREPVRENEPFEIVVGGVFPGATTVNPVVRLEPGRIVLLLPRHPGGPLINTPWGERVRIDGLPAGEYQIEVRGLERVQARHVFTVYEKPFTVTPMRARAGDEVIIEGVVLPECATPCPLPAVRFGPGEGTPSPRVRITAAGEMVAVVPPGLPGTWIDVTVQRGTTSRTLRKGAAIGDVDDEAYDFIILPLVYEGRGAHGSRWRSEITMRNDAPVAIELGPVAFGGVRPELAAGARLEIPPFVGTSMLLKLPRGVSHRLTFKSHVVDQSRTASNLGTEIPVVHREDVAPVVRLIDVPLTDRFRTHLRIYSFQREELDAGRVSIRATRRDGSHVDLGADMRFEPWCGIGSCGPETPASAFVDLSAVPELVNAGAVDLTIRGATNDLLYWAFVSVTNNETQRVTLWTPQHDNQTAGVAR